MLTPPFPSSPGLRAVLLGAGEPCGAGGVRCEAGCGLTAGLGWKGKRPGAGSNVQHTRGKRKQHCPPRDSCCWLGTVHPRHQHGKSRSFPWGRLRVCLDKGIRGRQGCEQALTGTTAGGCGTHTGCPRDTLPERPQADGTLPGTQGTATAEADASPGWAGRSLRGTGLRGCPGVECPAVLL